MRVVTVSALHQPFLNLVMERHIELRFCICMALEAELVLIRFQQLLACLAVVNTVAADTAHIVFAMRRAFKVGVLPLMAAQTACVDLLRGRLRGIEDLRHVAATVHVRLARPVTTFAGHAGFSVHLGDLGVWVRSEPL